MNKSSGDEEATDKPKMEHAQEKTSVKQVIENIKPELDELSSLEQELAKMYEPPTANVAPNNELDRATNVNCKSPAPIKESTNVNSKELNEERTVEDEDLIALLKGTDMSTDRYDTQIDCGVTIEGEGQFEIMEIVDDDVLNENEASSNAHNNSKPTAAYKIHNKNASAKTKLSPEEVRAVALEQMANLDKTKINRRKQENKTSQILNTLNDDWNEYDETARETTTGTATTATNSSEKVAQQDKKLTKTSTNNSTMLKNQTTKKLPDESAKDEKPCIANTRVETESTGFKRTRVIKRKIIWDPDVPETQKSYAQYVSTSARASPKVTSTTTTTTRTASPLAVESIKKEALPRAATPKKEKRIKPIADESRKSPKVGLTTPLVMLSKTEAKRRSQTPNPISNGSTTTVAKKKKKTETDRLLGDEGAANMIQAVAIEHRGIIENNNSVNTNFQKPFMRKRALTIAERPIKFENTTTTTPTATTIKTENEKISTIKAKRTAASKPRPSDAWDYVYKQRTSEESMIIRRRSNSSYSSNASVQRLSLDKTQNTIPTDDDSEEINDEINENNLFQFAKPNNKTQKNSRHINSPTSSTGGTLATDLKRTVRASSVARNYDKEKVNKDGQNSAAVNNDVTLKYYDKLAQIIINTQRAKIVNTYSLELLQKLTQTLNELAKSNAHNAVLITARGGQFCRGIDFYELTIDSAEKRKQHAKNLSTALKSYLQALCTFPKPIIVAVNGNLKNLGVMQLACFDFVVASDKCTFEASYAKIGQLPEGLGIFDATSNISATIKKRLFLLCEKLSLAEAGGLNGLVNKTTNAGKLQEETLAIAKKISENTADSYIVNKKFTNRARLEALKTLDTEINTINEQWLTAQCQNNFKNFIEHGQF